MRCIRISLAAAAGLAVATTASAGELDSDKARTSYSLGMSHARYYQSQEADLDTDAFIKGFRETMAGESELTEKQMHKLVGQFKQEIRRAAYERRKKLGKENQQAGETFLAKNAKRDGVKVTDSGLQYEVLEAGDGDKPGANDVLNVHYKGMKLNEETFINTWERGKPEKLAPNRMIEGMGEALQMMREGAKWKLYVPSDLAFGEAGAGRLIGPHATLIYEVELLEIVKKR